MTARDRAHVLGTICAAARWLCLMLAITALHPAAVGAHELRPAYLSIQEEGENEYRVLFKTPMQGDARLALTALLSGKVENLTAVVSRQTGDAMVQTWRIRAGESLAGRNILIDGLRNTMTDALVRVAFAGGGSWTARLTPSQPSVVIPASQSGLGVFAAYLRHGIEHIAFGLDHLLFVAALMLIVRGWSRLVKAVTAFTVAHSVTLAGATFGWLALPAKPVELMVALSIVIVAAEIVRMERGEASLAVTRPWIVAFAFGLLHGFGFAGALVGLGLPHGDIPLALLSFNVGVEIGQLAFVAVVLAAAFAVGRIFALPRHATVAAAYAIGVVATFWSLGRLEAMLL